MKSICIYATRTGQTERIARQIAESIGSETLAITDGKDYKGFFGYIRAAVAGLKKTPTAILPDRSLEDYDKVVICAPIWCENVNPFIRAFLTENGKRIRELYFVSTSMSGMSYAPKIDALCAQAGKPYSALLQVRTRKNDWREEVNAFIKEIGMRK